MRCARTLLACEQPGRWVSGAGARMRTASTTRTWRGKCLILGRFHAGDFFSCVGSRLTRGFGQRSHSEHACFGSMKRLTLAACTLALPLAGAEAITFTANTTIAAGDLTYDGQPVVVSHSRIAATRSAGQQSDVDGSPLVSQRWSRSLRMTKEQSVRALFTLPRSATTTSASFVDGVDEQDCALPGLGLGRAANDDRGVHGRPNRHPIRDATDGRANRHSRPGGSGSCSSGHR
jgi:hypothetical protein